MTACDVIVIGGGAAGLMAAGHAARLGARTLLLEKMSRPGRKLRITGKGRCNLTNVAPLPDFVEHFGPNGRFLYSAFQQFFTDDLIAFFAGLGVPTVIERGGRVFPASNEAGEVVDALARWATAGGVLVKVGAPVERLVVEAGRAAGVEVAPPATRRGQSPRTPPAAGLYRAPAVIVATGGASYPGTGSTGDGYRLAEAVGHTVIPVRPALVPLETAGDVAPRLQGLSLRNVRVTLSVDGRRPSPALSGKCCSPFRRVKAGDPQPEPGGGRRAGRRGRVRLTIDLKPALDEAALDARLLATWTRTARQQFHTVLKGLLPRRIDRCAASWRAFRPTGRPRITTRGGGVCAGGSGVLPGRDRLPVVAQAIITAGGVDLREIDPRTMESHAAGGGLYFAEVLDLDADTGGYNLQAAFSTGWLASRSAAGG